MCAPIDVGLFLTRRGIEGGGVIIRHVVRESAVGRPFPVTVVSIINFGVIVVAVDDGSVLVIVLQVLTAGLAAIHRRQTAAHNKNNCEQKSCAIFNNNNNKFIKFVICLSFSHPLIPLRKRR
jgi:hypothetical protein